MLVKDICARKVVATPRGTAVVEAAKLMRQHHVGEVVVTDGRRKPVGILTDRDIVLEVVAMGLAMEDLSVGDLISGELVKVQEDASLIDTVRSLRASGVRRAPVVGRGGALVGIVSLDDLVQVMAEELNAVARVISKGHEREAAMRP